MRPSLIYNTNLIFAFSKTFSELWNHQVRQVSCAHMRERERERDELSLHNSVADKRDCNCIRLRNRLTLDLSFCSLDFEVAQTADDYKQALTIAHDIYVRKGLMCPNKLGMRIEKQLFQNGSCLIVGKAEQSVLTCLSIYNDGPNGLPVYGTIHNISDIVQKDFSSVVEIGTFSKLCNEHALGCSGLFSMFRLAFSYIVHVLNAECIVIVVHPSHSNFYRCIWGFEHLAYIDKYDKVNNHPGAVMVLDLQHLNDELELLYSGSDVNSDLSSFMREDVTHILPSSMVSLKADFLREFAAEVLNSKCDMNPELQSVLKGVHQ